MFASGLARQAPRKYFDFTGKTGNFNGDSTVNFWNPFTALESALGISVLNNKGLNGARIADPFGSPSNQVCYNYDDMSLSVDFNLFMVGVNDAASLADVGPSFIGNTASTSNAVLMGAMNNIITGMRTLYPNKPFGWITPSYAVSGSITGVNVGTIATALKTVCDYRGVPCLNLNAVSGINGSNYLDYMPDGIHYDAGGYTYIMDEDDTFGGIVPFMKLFTNNY
jgi:lysophospholipase L1-like esterase